MTRDSLRVLLDATAIPANLGGVGRYVDDLSPELVSAGVDLVIAAKSHDVEHFQAKLPQAQVIDVGSLHDSRAYRMFWEQTGLPALVTRVRPDVLHSPHYTCPQWCSVPIAVTVHDATFFTHPDAHTAVKRVFFQQMIKRAVRRADALIVPSKSTRDETITFVGGTPARFTVAYHGVDRLIFHPVDDAERARVAQSLGLAGKHYVGFLGTLEPRKNVANLIRGWVQASAGLEQPPALVLAGGKGWDKEIEPALATVPSSLTVIRPGYLPLEDLPGFLSGCDLLVYPSIAEGFGLPVLEAMSCGAATLTTRQTSLPEVGGDAVAYCGISEGSIAQALTTLLKDDARRRALSKAAVTRAATFTWKAAAEQHIRAYEEAIRFSRQRH